MCQARSTDLDSSVLAEDQARFITAFVDFLLPKTETPGGLDVKADIFIDSIYAKTYDEAGQKKCDNRD
ncbi:gluconate 2-dehydrogenase subunit 3 family protein [Algoriphagus boritolerans]|uniref:gluconate 2-dehydrogenase subunit 3 family protein n=1 Tax=Algoriphagus boritolerans TaxID=308111 RepID=UPI002FCE561E